MDYRDTAILEKCVSELVRIPCIMNDRSLFCIWRMSLCYTNQQSVKLSD